MSFLGQFNKVLQSLSPPPLTLLEEYDGPEYPFAKYLAFRPGLLKTEAFILAGVLFYVLFFFLGKRNNEQRVNAWCDAHASLYEKQFSKPAAGGVTQDGYSDFFLFSTGRRLVASLHTVFTLRPRHDLSQTLYQVIRELVQLTWVPQDEIQLDFKLHPDVVLPGFVWALVSKNELTSIQKERWDLTWTRSSENPALPQWASVMTEFADVTENLLKLGEPVFKALRDPAIQPYFRSLSVTDLPREHPDSLKHEKHVILSLHSLPSSSAHLSLPLITALFQFVDALPRTNLRPETKKKLAAKREEFLKELKEEREKPKREEALEAKAAAKKKAEDERMAKLTAAEQQKLLERDRKKAMRKQGKMSVRKS
ncbi:DUF1682-domain-containing protein [Stereum hirsutum FP-91666 SS1]|uniref:DUF1682-domain-containing protein n=1 Tax=Stereum hirsutum (strain FP-91666) TaxID=721885 RepID=UPI000440D975|nr:DUF1682-domain-containing protein [Stereum hirsutum FP-91666 SS1]EIM88428.1 DUF1682-domain-containing protein [Stereum hirsutum FP-91666 SS1]